MADRGKIDKTARVAALAVHRVVLTVSRAGRAAVLLGSRWRDLLLPAALLAASLVALSVDFPLSRWCIAGRCPGNVWDTFGRFLPLTSAGSGGQSFPSAHTASAFGLAVALIWLYPRGRGFFMLLAVLVACQRINGGAHYLSDTLCGAAVGCLVATLLIRKGLPAAWFDRFEYHLEALDQPSLRVAQGLPASPGEPAESDKQPGCRHAA